ncbi:MAG: hypothetical protein KDK70_16300 [Myxococcales bacterium]|nr:hypothetical protein [Myxococcales bacterium]
MLASWFVEHADEEFLRTFYQSLADRPLEPDEAWYVPIYSGAASSRSDPVQRLARGIQWAPLESVQLFSGFRGTGKSTELRRLRRDLTAQGYTVVLCDMKHYLNLSTPVDISDFLISAAGALSDALAEDALLGKDLAKRDYWERAVDFLRRTEINVGNLQATTKLADTAESLRVGLRQDPAFRQLLQERMKGHLGRLVDDVRAFMADCVHALRRKHEDAKLVVLFDSIEQIRGSSVNDAEVFSSVETLFVGHPDKLRFQGMHVVYTVPPWLKIRSPGATKLYDGGYLLPCVKVRQRSGEPFEEGLETLRRIVRERGDWARVFASQADLDHVLLQTGGYLRDLFRALQGMLMSVAERGVARLDREAIELELAGLRNDYLPISNADARWLHQVARSHEAELPAHDELPELSRYFDTHLLLCYRNGDEWYDLHPLIQETVERLAVREPAGDA